MRVLEKEILPVDVSTWSRLVEVIEYAEVNGITVSAAVRELVSSGLSHQRRSYLPYEGSERWLG
jgi:hypothetical protein